MHSTTQQTSIVHTLCINAFSDVRSRSFAIVNDFFAFLTLLSIFTIVLESVESFSAYHPTFLFIEFVTVFFFLIEYMGRLIAAENKIRYIFSFFGVIDLLAIVPSLLGLSNFTFLKSARILRILRFLRILRLAKILRIKRHKEDFDEHSHDALYHTTLQIYITALFAAILIGGSLIYVFESTQTSLSNIPLGMIWATKVLLGGVPQLLPQTLGGEFVTIFLRFIGLILFGLLINIVGGSVKKLLFGTAELIEKK